MLEILCTDNALLVRNFSNRERASRKYLSQSQRPDHQQSQERECKAEVEDSHKYAKGDDLAKPGAKMIDEERAGRAAIVTSNELIRGAKTNQSASVWRKSTAKLPQSNG